MDALLKAVKKSPLTRTSPSSKAKHEKLPDKWGEHREPVNEGITFYAKYLGSTLVEELDEEGESYGDHISTEAVRTVVTMAKASRKPGPKMAITISPGGIKVQNVTSKEVFTDMSIYRINFCTADKNHDKVFAYISRSTENETMECHCFLCPKRKIAQAVTLTVAQAFNIAKDDWDEKEQKERENMERRAFEGGSTAGSDTVATGTLIDCGSWEQQQTDSCQLAQPLGFEDNFTDADADSFDMLAKSRSQNSLQRKAQANPFTNSRFHTGLRDEEIDDSVLQLSRGQGHGGQGHEQEEPMGMDDLLSL